MSNIEKRLSAAARAISGNKYAAVRMRANENNTELNNSKIINLPNFDEKPKEEIVILLRGETDLASLALKHHSGKIHKSLRPNSPEAAVIFDALERTRLEIIGSNQFAGVKNNLEKRLENYCKDKGYDKLSENDIPPFADILSLMLRQQTLGVKPPKIVAKLVEAWQIRLNIMAGKLLSDLPEYVDNQAKYAGLVNKIITNIATKLAQETDTENNSSDEPTNGNENPDDENQDNQQEGDGNQDQEEEQTKSGQGEDEQDYNSFALSDEVAPIDAEALMTDLPQQPSNAISAKINYNDLLNSKEYHVFSREFDEVIDAEKLTTPEEIARLRAMLDMKLVSLHSVTGKLSSRLQKLLMAKQARNFEYDLDDGVIDNARLSRVIINPNYGYIYKAEKETDFRDTIVSLLIDNSGSMRGRPITVAASVADILSRTLEKCGVKVEILGFTTCDWKGGKTRKKWLEMGRTPNPGRLNDIRHIIYKSANTNWQKARKNIGIMLKEGILKENIDGEAILWAHNRLLARPEQRRILMVISDGAPVDDSTLSSNNGGYLERNLLTVIKTIEDNSNVELIAIGIGHDVTRYYKRAVTISDVSQLADVMAKELVRVFS
jgi:cobaltochelatase CobT